MTVDGAPGSRKTAKRLAGQVVGVGDARIRLAGNATATDPDPDPAIGTA